MRPFTAHLKLTQYCKSIICVLSHVQLFATPGTAAHNVSLSMGFPRQKYWSGLPLPSLRDLPNPETKLASSALAGRFLATESPEKPNYTPI